MTAIRLATEDGVADAHLFHPEKGGPSPGVIFFMDGLGLRPGLIAMAERLATHGYAVLLPDLYYRSGPRPPFDPGVALADPKQREQLAALFASIDGRAVTRDTRSFLDFMAGHPAVRSGPFGCVGYCMGGGYALLAAGKFPDRVAAIASFHGTNLATDRELSPHRLAAAIRATVYVGVAEIDPWLAPGETQRLRETLTAAHVAHEIEVYAGVQHGFAVPDLPVYDENAAELHWRRLLELFAGLLKGTHPFSEKRGASPIPTLPGAKGAANDRTG